MIPKSARIVNEPWCRKSRTWKMTSSARLLKIESIIESASKGLLVSSGNTKINFKNLPAKILTFQKQRSYLIGDG
jgi:hypothetical protein